MTYVSFPGLGIEPFHMDKTFSVFGRPIAWYGLIICIGIILAVTYSMLRAKYTEKISVDTITDLAFFICHFRFFLSKFGNFRVSEPMTPRPPPLYPEPSGQGAFSPQKPSTVCLPL